MSANIQTAAEILVRSCTEQDARSPREAAEAAFVPGGPSVDDLEQRIHQQRHESPAPLRDTA